MTGRDFTDRTERKPQSVDRRQFIGVGAGVGVALLAGCTGQSDTGPTGETTNGTSTGTFRLLISDQPVAIDEFDALDVSFDRARIFPADGEADEETEDAETNESTGDDTEAAAANESDDGDTNDEDIDESAGDEDGAGFSIIDLGGATVDLTQVVGDKAIGVFEGELTAGRYAKIELYASDVEGIVDGETADVKIPSGKLQIVKPFEVTPGEPVSFVFDINVVRKGNNGYNLLPVISESGVAGKDVDVEEIGESRGDDEADGSDDAGNETDDDGETAGNETDADESGGEADMAEERDSDSAATNETAESGQ